jgi:2'-5' RNA ligase
VAERSLRRVFFALWPDAGALDGLEAAALTAEVVCEGRRMRRDSLHVTLAFIGDVGAGQLALLQDLAGKVSSGHCEIALDRLGWWPHNRILWAGCTEVPSCLGRLHEHLCKPIAAAGFTIESRPFAPHVTLLRNARSAILPALPGPIRWTAREFVLAESLLRPAGARYRILARWPLHARD